MRAAARPAQKADLDLVEYQLHDKHLVLTLPVQQRVSRSRCGIQCMQRSIRAASQRINTLNLHSASTGRIRSIERATGKDNRHELAAQPYFNAEVVPNLPAASSRAALLSLLPRWA